MGLPVFQVDAFAESPFTGNPAAVCLLDQEADTQWMQSVAVEMNLSETAFVRKQSKGFELRWFTPVFEVDLCGHATLASAHVLWSEGFVSRDREIEFHTRSGLLSCRIEDELIRLDFPSTPPVETASPDGLLSALGISSVRYVGKSIYDVFLVVDSEEMVRTLSPDFGRLAEVKTRGVIVTAESDDPAYDFLSRYFAPVAGINEDPVTGSVHCCLGPYWQQQLGQIEFRGVSSFTARRHGQG